MMNMPPLTKNLIIVNVLLFLASITAQRWGVNLNDFLGLHFFLAPDFHFYQLFTYMFMHAGLEHIFFNMFAVWMFGRVMEGYWGWRRFLTYYLVCGVGAGLMQEGVQYISYLWQGLDEYQQVNTGYQVMSMASYLNSWTTVGASGAVYGILLAFGMSFPNEPLFIFPLPMPIKAKFFVIGYAVIELFSAMSRSNDGVAHFAHLGGMLFGLLLILYWRKKYNSYYAGGSSLTDAIKNAVQAVRSKVNSRRKPKMTIHMSGDRKADYDYNAQRKEREEEIDRILEKVRKHGYQCLSEEEKRTLFDASKR